jgi:site-specific DNA recombinase
MLKGLVRCAPCDSAMVPHHSKKGNKRYRYYTCCSAQKNGWKTCPSKSIPAGELEQYVVDQIRRIGQDPALQRATVEAARVQTTERLAELEGERRGQERDLGRWNAEVRDVVAQNGVGDGGSATVGRLADLQERMRNAETRIAAIRQEVEDLSRSLVSDDEVAVALSEFDAVWQALTPREQARIIHLLIQRVDYDGEAGTVAITFHPEGIKMLAGELAHRPKEKSA